NLLVGMPDVIPRSSRLVRLGPIINHRLEPFLDGRILLLELALAQTPLELRKWSALALLVEGHELLIFCARRLIVLFPPVFLGDLHLVPLDLAELLPAIEGKLVELIGAA